MMGTVARRGLGLGDPGGDRMRRRRRRPAPKPAVDPLRHGTRAPSRWPLGDCKPASEGAEDAVPRTSWLPLALGTLVGLSAALTSTGAAAVTLLSTTPSTSLSTTALEQAYYTEGVKLTTGSETATVDSLTLKLLDTTAGEQTHTLTVALFDFSVSTQGALDDALFSQSFQVLVQGDTVAAASIISLELNGWNLAAGHSYGLVFYGSAGLRMVTGNQSGISDFGDAGWAVNGFIYQRADLVGFLYPRLGPNWSHVPYLRLEGAVPAVPEPATAALGLAGGLGLLALRRRSQSAR